MSVCLMGNGGGGRGGSKIWQWGGGGGGKILSVAHKSVADPGFEVTGGPTFFRN